MLYVEDDEDNWDVAALRLAAHYTMLRAASAQEACALVRERASITLVMMDIELRGSDLGGPELAQVLRGRAASPPSYASDLPVLTCPIIFVTAHTEQNDAVKRLLEGGERVISKPVNFSELMAALASETTRSR